MSCMHARVRTADQLDSEMGLALGRVSTYCTQWEMVGELGKWALTWGVNYWTGKGVEEPRRSNERARRAQQTTRRNIKRWRWRSVTAHVCPWITTWRSIGLLPELIACSQLYLSCTWVQASISSSLSKQHASTLPFISTNAARKHFAANCIYIVRERSSACLSKNRP